MKTLVVDKSSWLLRVGVLLSMFVFANVLAWIIEQANNDQKRMECPSPHPLEREDLLSLG